MIPNIKIFSNNKWLKWNWPEANKLSRGVEAYKKVGGEQKKDLNSWINVCRCKELSCRQNTQLIFELASQYRKISLCSLILDRRRLSSFSEKLKHLCFNSVLFEILKISFWNKKGHGIVFVWIDVSDVIPKWRYEFIFRIWVMMQLCVERFIFEEHSSILWLNFQLCNFKKK